MSSSPGSTSSLKSQVSFRETSYNDWHDTGLQGISGVKLDLETTSLSDTHVQNAASNGSIGAAATEVELSTRDAPQSTNQVLHFALVGKMQSDVNRLASNTAGSAGDASTFGDKSGSSGTADEFLTQVQLAPPSLSTVMSETDAPASIEAQSRPEPSIRGSHNLALHYGIEIGLDGRIARHMCKIPKAQMKLLEGDEKWYPPLVGAATRSGTVPLPLLNALSAKVDNLFQNPTEKDIDVSNETHGTNNQNSDKVVGVSVDSARSDTSESPAEWSPSSSPSQKHNERPPDSPLEKSQPIRQYHAEPLNDRALFDTTSNAREGMQASSPPAYEQHAANVATSSNSTATYDDSNVNLPKPCTQLDSTQHAGAVRLPSHPVQVDRTPYPVKNTSNDYSRYDPISLIPGTFDEKVERRTEASDHRTASRTKGKPEPDFSKQQHNYSQHDGLQVRPADREVTEVLTAREKASMKIPGGRESMSTSTSASNARSKRGSSEVGSPETRDGKRNRQSLSRLLVGFQDSEAYAEMDTERRADRRNFFRTISSKQGIVEAQPPVLSSPSEALQDDALTNSLDASKAPDLLGARPIEGLSTGNVSTGLATGLKTKEESPRQRTTPRSTGHVSTSDLYNTFLVAYPSYAGERSDFDTACQLLQDLCTTSPVHPLMWDAFIFHLHHDYKPYLRKCGQKAHKVQSYKEFFNEVDSSECDKRIVTRLSLSRKPTGYARVTKTMPDMRTSGQDSTCNEDSAGIRDFQKSLPAHHAPYHRSDDLEGRFSIYDYEGNQVLNTGLASATNSGSQSFVEHNAVHAAALLSASHSQPQPRQDLGEKQKCDFMLDNKPGLPTNTSDTYSENDHDESAVVNAPVPARTEQFSTSQLKGKESKNAPLITPCAKQRREKDCVVLTVKASGIDDDIVSGQPFHGSEIASEEATAPASAEKELQEFINHFRIRK